MPNFAAMKTIIYNLCIAVWALAATQCKAQTKYEIPAQLKDRPEQILQRKGYTASYNSQTKTPNWVAWHLTAEHTRGRYQRREEMFSEDESVKAPRATNMDYYNSQVRAIAKTL